MSTAALTKTTEWHAEGCSLSNCDVSVPNEGSDVLQIEAAIEALDPEHTCQEFWHGKEDRDAARQGQPPPSAASDSGSAPSAGPRKARKPRRPRYLTYTDCK